MNSNSEMIIQAQNITKRFGGMVAVNNVTFGLKKNEVAGLIGANGAGKTTFFNILTGNYFPEEGKVYYKDLDITDYSPESRVDLGIMRTFQLASTFDNLKVIDNMRSLITGPRIKPTCGIPFSPGLTGLYPRRLMRVWKPLV